MCPSEDPLPGQMVIFRDGAPSYITVRERQATAPERRVGTAKAVDMRRFYFDRTTDVSGTSGTGAVAEGVQFSDGRVALRWITAGSPSSTVVYDSIDDAEAIHGHGGGTKVVWIDGG